MFLRRLVTAWCLCTAFCLAGCSGGNDPVNAGKDLPVSPKKEKEKDKDKEKEKDKGTSIPSVRDQFARLTQVTDEPFVGRRYQSITR